MNEVNTPQESGRTKAAGRDERWEAAYLAQLTNALADSVGAFAKKRASWLEGKTKRKDNYLWRELLQDALTDTWLGEVSWDPEKAPLDLHLKQVIRSRTTMTMKHLTKFPRVAAHLPRLALEHEMSNALEIQHASSEGADLSRFVDGVVGTLYMFAADDDEVLQILDCFGKGIVERRDILRSINMTATAYHNARRRLLTLVERLPQNLREEAIQAMA
ncbi:MAG: hypothetical protein QM831_21995 [Kofleriaceae bacterium]